MPFEVGGKGEIISNCENLKAMRQESGVRRQNEKSRNEYLFSTDYWLLTTNFASNLQLYAPCSMPYAFPNPKFEIRNCHFTPPRT